MFGALMGFLAGLWGSSKDIAADWWDQAGKLLKNGWGAMVIIFGLIWTALKYLVDSMGTIVDTLQAVLLPQYSHGNPWSEYLAIPNTFLPVSEFFGFAIAYMLLLGALSVYKAIKSWIPGGFG
jgi:hypothetical protein